MTIYGKLTKLITLRVFKTADHRKDIQIIMMFIDMLLCNKWKIYSALYTNIIVLFHSPNISVIQTPLGPGSHCLSLVSSSPFMQPHISVSCVFIFRGKKKELLKGYIPKIVERQPKQKILITCMCFN